MMGELRELYQEVIFDHNRNPRNFHIMENANRTVEGYNPLCGDRLTLYLNVQDGIIRDASFQGSGCAISTASVS
ncbi:MAG: iron-sulfur cluster assembly scaffold protein, partial [Methylococcales bacterium]